jgi:hypothetical protein
VVFLGNLLRLSTYEETALCAPLVCRSGYKAVCTILAELMVWTPFIRCCLLTLGG